MRVAALFVVSGLLFAACGGGSDSAEPSATTTPTSATTPETSPPATDAPAPDPTQPAPPSTEPLGAEPPTTEPPAAEPPAADSIVVTSPDGNLAIRVAGAEHESIAPTVGILDPADWPPELAGAETSEGVMVYDLQPAGATFEQPVVVTRRLDAASFPELGPFDLPLVTLLTYSDGVYELLDGHTALRVGDEIFVSGTTSHFSGLIAVRGFADIQINENLSITGFLDRSIENREDIEDVDFELDQAEIDFDFDFEVGLSPSSDELGYLSESDFETYDSADFDPGQALLAYEGVMPIRQDLRHLGIYDDGTGIGLAFASATFELPVWSVPSAAQLLGEAIDAEIDTFEYEAALFLATVPDEFYDDALDLVDEMLLDLDVDIELIAEVFHQEFGAYPSSIRRRFSGLSPLPRGLAAFSGLFEGSLDDPRLVSLAPLREIDGELVAESGIECFCEYGEMLFFLGADDAATLEALMALPEDSAGAAEFWQFVWANPDSVAARVVSQADADAVMSLAVSAAEGELANESVTLTPYP